MAEKEYEDALKALGGLINQRKRADGSNWGDAFSLMRVYLKILELESAIDELSIIHVAGTKGKGSTCAFAESILRACGHSTGLFTSPHLVDVRERFRINGEMVQIPLFLEHFWWCHNKCKAACEADPSLPMPAYFRFLTLLGLRLFTHLKVDVALLEVGIGGRYDATNVVNPVVCGVSTLGFDHMELLGDTLALIAGEKAGIFKQGVPAITAPQEEEALLVLERRAEELQIPLTVLAPGEGIPPKTPLGLAGRHQRINASLAVALPASWAEHTGRGEEALAVKKALQAGTLPPAYLRGLQTASWLGRSQVVRDVCPVIDAQAGQGSGATGSGLPDPSLSGEGATGGGLSFYLDGAHTPESMEVCGDWFCDALAAEGEGVLQSGGEGREGTCLPAGLPQQEPLGNPRAVDPPGVSSAGPESGLGQGLGQGQGLQGEGRVSRGEENGNALTREAHGEMEGVPALPSTSTSTKVLLFNCMPERDPEVLFSNLLRTLHRRGVGIELAIFVPSLSSYTTLVLPQLPASSSSNQLQPGTLPLKQSPPQPEMPPPPHSPPPVDLTWQLKMQSLWERLQDSHKRSSAVFRGSGQPDAAAGCEEAAGRGAGPVAGTFTGTGASAGGDSALRRLLQGVAGTLALQRHSAVLPSLPAALDILRRSAAAQGHPRKHLKVLVTGSLHLVGDVLKVLQK